jgi:hypothetical protein
MPPSYWLTGARQRERGDGHLTPSSASGPPVPWSRTIPTRMSRSVSPSPTSASAGRRCHSGEHHRARARASWHRRSPGAPAVVLQARRVHRGMTRRADDGDVFPVVLGVLAPRPPRASTLRTLSFEKKPRSVATTRGAWPNTFWLAFNGRHQQCSACGARPSKKTWRRRRRGMGRAVRSWVSELRRPRIETRGAWSARCRVGLGTPWPSHDVLRRDLGGAGGRIPAEGTRPCSSSAGSSPARQLHHRPFRIWGRPRTDAPQGPDRFYGRRPACIWSLLGPNRTASTARISIRCAAATRQRACSSARRSRPGTRVRARRFAWRTTARRTRLQ